jgi:glycolate oxidase FAD binding subunit
MTPDFDQLAQRLIAELGTAAISTDAPPLNTYSVDGKRGALICRPASAPEVAAALRLCSEAQAHVTPRGGGTAMTLGNPPRRVDVIIDLQKLNRVLDHDAANLTVTAQSGLKLSVLQDALAQHKQFAPFDAPFPDRATIGGTIAANLNGPRRSAYGSVRDLVIGIKVALANGEQIKAGGKVVKNVAGYDLGKLFVGSLGTLGIITETTVRVAPIAECFATVVASGNLPNALALIEAVDRSPLLPAALALVNEPMKSHWRAAIWCEGFEETVARYRRDLTALADQFGATTEVLAGRAHDEFWSRINNLPLMPNRLIVRVTLPRAELAVFVTMIDHHGAITIAGDVAAGTLWLVLEPNQATMQLFAEVQAIAHEHHGHAVLFAAPAVLKQGIEVWGPAPATLSLMREIKRQFDPLGLLNSGRFLGGI